jgi:oxygen-independent coproporphyrinogen-3 oxidase
MTEPDLLSKYNIPVPRYTSYPTVPYWQDGIDPGAWRSVFGQQFSALNRVSGISLYLHLPFCETLCTYCGCNKRITTNHGVEEPYISALLREWGIYRSWMNETPLIRELHLGGGTPTFFSPANLERLVQALLKDSIVHPDAHFSLEGHPNNTTAAHLEALFRCGFRRISYGVQDNDPQVQRVINRIQPFENVQRATEAARAAGYESVNFDLIYGLPLQTPESMRRTILQCTSLKPDRVAFYSYAHVPWTSRGQRLFDERDLPGAALKMQLYQLGRTLFREQGYTDIGMDHFALPHDALYKAWTQGSLHRNFMGYTTQDARLLLGLGVSAISDAESAFVQNSKSLADYYRKIDQGEPAVEKGYFLNAEDKIFRRYIRELSCSGSTRFDEASRELLETFTFPELEKLRVDGLVLFDDTHAEITPAGRDFIRNICRAFDLHLLRSGQSGKPVYSRAV